MLFVSELFKTSTTGTGFNVLVAEVDKPKSPMMIRPREKKASGMARPSASSSPIPRAIASPKWLK